MTSREQFETEACQMILANHPDSGLTIAEIAASRDGETYSSSTWAGMWWAWQASRAAVEVELPEKWDEYTEAGSAACDAIDECCAAIEAAGLRVRQP